MSRYQVIVLGVGAMGGAACLSLARRGVSVLGIEQHTLGHALGSSHGESRLIRQAYFEHPSYVPLLFRAYELWRELEQETGEALFTQNGLVIYGPTNAPIVEGVRRSSRLHGVPITEMDGAEARARFPVYEPPAGHVALLEPGAGFLRVEASVVAHAAAARKHGAEIREGESVLSVHESADEVVVETTHGRYRAEQVVVTAGAWNPAFLKKAAPKLTVNRVPLVWFDADARYDLATGIPCFGFELPEGFFYGVPKLSEHGVKMGLHKPGAPVANPALLDRTLRPEDVAPLQGFLRQCLPGVSETPRHHAVCMYVMSPDEDFIVDREGRTTYAAGFSGHGFKFAPVIGEVLADLATAGRTRHPVEFLRFRWA